MEMSSNRKTTLNMIKTSDRKTTVNRKITSYIRPIKNMKPQLKKTKPNLPNQIYKTKYTKLNKTYQTKPAKVTMAKPKIKFISQVGKFKIC